MNRTPPALTGLDPGRTVLQFLVLGRRALATRGDVLLYTIRKDRSALVRKNDFHVVDCRAFDISRGGIGILSAEGFPGGAVLALALQVPTAPGSPERRIVAAKAKVVFQVLSAGQYRTGFEWVAPGDALLAALGPWTPGNPG